MALLLLESNSAPNLANLKGQTPLHFAVEGPVGVFLFFFFRKILSAELNGICFAKGCSKIQVRK